VRPQAVKPKHNNHDICKIADVSRGMPLPYTYQNQDVKYNITNYGIKKEADLTQGQICFFIS